MECDTGGWLTASMTVVGVGDVSRAEEYIAGPSVVITMLAVKGCFVFFGGRIWVKEFLM